MHHQDEWPIKKTRAANIHIKATEHWCVRINTNPQWKPKLPRARSQNNQHTSSERNTTQLEPWHSQVGLVRGETSQWECLFRKLWSSLPFWLGNAGTILLHSWRKLNQMVCELHEFDRHAILSAEHVFNIRQHRESKPLRLELWFTMTWKCKQSESGRG